MKITILMLATAAFLPLAADSLWAETAAADSLDQQCILRLANEGDAAMTLADLRAACRLQADSMPVSVQAEAAEQLAVEESPVDKRLEQDRDDALRPFSLMAHKPNYVLVGAYNTKGWADYPTAQAAGSTTSFEDYEAQFQVSIKVPLGIGLFNDHMDFYTAYTNRSFWQVYDHVDSEPFRETNHEPEAWLQFRNDWQVFGFTNSVNSVGFVHQSNGQGGDLSRGWNRLYGNFVFNRGHWAIGIKPWAWVFQSESDDDNPDIDDYMGHGELRMAYSNKGHTFSAMIRNQLESGFDRGAVELSWSIPVFDYPYLRAYIQYFNGYGESLIDYNRKVNRIGIGIAVTDWLP